MKLEFLPKLSLQRPVSILMVFFALLVLGLISYSKIPLELMPTGFSEPFLYVFAPYAGVSPQDIEEQITKPMEEMLSTVRSVKELNSNSGGNFWGGTGAGVGMGFFSNTDMRVAYNQVRDRIDRVRPELPADIPYFYIWKYDPNDEPIYWFAMKIDEDKLTNEGNLRRMFETQVQRRLEQVDGVARVELFGVEDKKVLVELSKDRIQAHRVNLFGLIQKLRNSNFNLASGDVTEGEKKILLRSLASFSSIDQVAALKVGQGELRLVDLGDVRYDFPKKTSIHRVDGRKTALFAIYKESLANTVETCNRIEEVVKGEFPNNPIVSDFKTEIFFTQGGLINESIDNLLNSGKWGAIFAVLILFFFLRRLRMTFLISMAIPMSLLITIVVMYFRGDTLNMMSLMGLMLGVGMVIDNSIVVVESIYRHRQLAAAGNKESHRYILKGAQEVALAITMATLTTVVVFLPLILMNDEPGFTFYMSKLGLPVCFALLASLFVALVFIPQAASRLTSSKPTPEPRLILWFNRLYAHMLEAVMKHRFEALLASLLLIFSISIPAGRIATSDRAEGNINDVRMRFFFPASFDIEDSNAYVAKVEASVDAQREPLHIRTAYSRVQRNSAMVRVFLEPSDETGFVDNFKQTLFGSSSGRLTRQETIDKLKELAPEEPGVELRIGWGGGEDLGSSIQLRLYGDDSRRLRDLSKEVVARLQTIEEIASVSTESDEADDEIHVRIKRELAGKMKLDPTWIAGTLQYSIRGRTFTKYQIGDQEIDVQVYLREADRETLQQVKNLQVTTAAGTDIPLSAVADFEIVRGLDTIRHHNRKTVMNIEASTTSDALSTVFRKIDDALEGIEFPPGYSLEKGERADRLMESNEAQQFALIMATSSVFLLMGILFESWVLPLVVVLTIPFAFVGSFWMLWLTGTTMDFMANIGMIILIGIIVNNSIVLIDHINRLRQEGMSRDDAIREAGKARFRPIMMTALTTIFGLLPMAIGNAGLIGIPYAPLGRSVIGGMAFGTFVTPLVVPLLYTYMDDLREKFWRPLLALWARS